MKLSALAYAKINLFLKVVGKRDDGLHDLDMIMQSISLADKVTVEDGDTIGVKAFCNCDIIDDNIAERAALEYFKSANMPTQNIKISIEKNIPISAGLAGGSADAAAVLYILNRMYNKLSETEIVALAGKIGADVPFCLIGGTARVKGFGDVIEKQDVICNSNLVLIKAGTKKSTGYMYSLIDESNEIISANAEELLTEMKTGKPDAFRFMHNDFKQFWTDETSVAVQIDLINCGADAVSLSGSGPTFFGVFNDKQMAENCYNNLKNKYDDIYLCQPVSSGIEIIE
ncbi:MAG: 4-(cytidine 5'-diphospho)-2-C-methyl-D-erythritol kinase [Clostridia bacterium]|nr:4-(cytidine 5'-diphospho)-2-C-methyl-D-erythritol kinase [Clostridia bacterium]